MMVLLINLPGGIGKKARRALWTSISKGLFRST